MPIMHVHCLCVVAQEKLLQTEREKKAAEDKAAECQAKLDAAQREIEELEALNVGDVCHNTPA
jgi:hypothetical protein